MLPFFAGTLLAACGDDSRPKPLQPSVGTSSGGTSGSSSSSSGSGGSGGSDNTGGEGGSDVIAGPDCGNDQLDGAEECDGEDFGVAACSDFGFDDGTLSCSDECTIETDDCSGVESCSDGRDNDGDGDVDCSDDDCAALCEDPCQAPETVDDPVEITASTFGRSDVVSSTCSESSSDPGPDVAYRLVAANTGTLEIELESASLMHVAVASACGGAASSCSSDFLSLPVTEGDEIYVAVESHTTTDIGTFTLRIHTRENNVCADGYRDPAEECDDNNKLSLDGCSADCELESEENEPNDSEGEEDSYTDGWFAAVDPEGDVDVIEFELPYGPGSATVTVLGLGDECGRNLVDSFLELLESDATTVIDSDDDSGQGYCSRLVATGLSAGTYYARVSASPTGETPTFPYELLIETNYCGDGVRGPGEECDDGDQMNGNGCSSTCESE